MASNDMNSWDEDPDELLRQDWQQAFDTFKVESRPSLRRRILSQAMAHYRPKPMGWLVGGALLFLISTVLIYTVRRGNRPTAVQTLIAGTQPAQLTHPDRSESMGADQPTASARLASPSEKSETGIPVNEPTTSQLPKDRQPTMSGTETATPDDKSRRSFVPTNRSGLRTESRLPLAASHRASQPFAKSVRHASTGFPVALPPSVRSSYRERINPLADNTDNGPGDSSVEAPISRVSTDQLATPALAVMFTRLNTPKLSLLPSSLRALSDHLPANESVTSLTDPAVHRIRRGKQWFVEVVPLSSFQLMSTPSASSVHLTQVNAPSAFSSATWGYQVNGGIRWQRWQAYVSAGQLRRWAYYTANENRYRMDFNSSGSSSVEPVREKHVVAENVALPMVGIGLSHYRFLGQGRYTVEFGSQVAYSPMDGQTLASLRGGAGRRLPISRRLDLQAGLVVEYGLTRLMSEQQQMTIHPIVVGVGLRIQPRSYSQKR